MEQGFTGPPHLGRFSGAAETTLRGRHVAAIRRAAQSSCSPAFSGRIARQIGPLRLLGPARSGPRVQPPRTGWATPIFPMIRDTWTPAVLSLMNRVSAICRFVFPAARHTAGSVPRARSGRRAEGAGMDSPGGLRPHLGVGGARDGSVGATGRGRPVPARPGARSAASGVRRPSSERRHRPGQAPPRRRDARRCSAALPPRTSGTRRPDRPG